MIKRFIVLTCFFVAGLTAGLVAAGLLARTPEAASDLVPDKRVPPPSPVDKGPLFPGPIEIEASLRRVSRLVSFRPDADQPAGAQAEEGRGAQLVGAWALNRDLSDDPRANPAPPAAGGRTGRGGGGVGGGFGGFGGRRGGGDGGRGGFDPARMEAMQEVLENLMQAPERLTIVERNGEILITDSDGRTQSLKPDGRKVQQKVANGLVSVTRKTEWNGATLVSQVEIDNGPTIIQTYARSEGGSQLVTTTKVDNSRGRQPMEIKRVYDPADAGFI